MKIIKLHELYKTDFEISNIFALKQTWSTGSIFEMNHPRPQNGIIYLKNCTGIYTAENGCSFTADKGSIVWLPEGSKYTCYNLSAEEKEADAYLIQFNMVHKGKPITPWDSPFKVNTEDNYAVLSVMKQLSELNDAALTSPVAIKAAAYSLISLLCREYSSDINKKYQCISKGIEYLERNPTSNISVEELSAMCNVASGTFRRLFKEYSGKSPVAFRIDKQIDIAKNMLSGEYMTIADICRNLEIENIPYFCKLFLKKTGMTPSKYRKSILRSE